MGLKRFRQKQCNSLFICQRNYSHRKNRIISRRAIRDKTAAEEGAGMAKSQVEHEINLHTIERRKYSLVSI